MAVNDGFSWAPVVRNITERAPQVQPVEQERRTQRERKQRPTDPHTHPADRRDSRKNSFISMAVGATNDRLPIDAHWDGRWNT